MKKTINILSLAFNIAITISLILLAIYLFVEIDAIRNNAASAEDGDAWYRASIAGFSIAMLGMGAFLLIGLSIFSIIILVLSKHNSSYVLSIVLAAIVLDGAFIYFLSITDLAKKGNEIQTLSVIMVISLLIFASANLFIQIYRTILYKKELKKSEE